MAFALLGCGGGRGGDPSPLTVDLYGDSIMRGAGVQVSPAARLREHGFVVDDYSANGLMLRSVVNGYQTPYTGAPAAEFPRGPQLPFAEVPRTARVVVIQTGVNDSLEPADDFAANLRAAIVTAKAEGRAVVLTGVVRIPEGPVFFNADAQPRLAANNAATHALATEYSLQHAGWGEAYRGAIDLHPDQIHRTQEASDRLAALLIEAIERADR
ncbi:MAG: SGNH/GDSL hydrolase family protein [Gammaproteobacteria bacterium]|nr:SGNH/GDSL hydrolase family protein [Gammaproteobacteria bacterium]MBU1816441.1 SGNH/GDSL hydrolase family protein [Gammaproteobacteria bacterium]